MMNPAKIEALDDAAPAHLHFSLAAKQIIDNVSDIAFTLTYPDADISYANRTTTDYFRRMFRVRDLLGRSLKQFLDRDAAKSWSGFIAQAVAVGIFETEYTWSNDSHQWQLRLLPILLEGRCIGVSVTGQDRTEMEAARRQLAETEGMYISLFESMGIGAVFQDSEGRIIAVNKAALEIEGRTAAQMLGLTSSAQDWDAIREDGSPFPGDDHPSMVTLRTGAPQIDVTMGIRRPDGERRWIVVNSRPVLVGRDREIRSVVTTFHDVTEKLELREHLEAKIAELDRALEQTLAAVADRRREQLRFRSALQAAPTAMIMVDITGTIILANDRADIMFGYEKGALIGQPLSILLPLSTVKMHEDLRRQYMRQPEERLMGDHRAIHARHKDGYDFRVEIGLTPITDEMGSFVLASITDLRAQLEAQQRIERLTNFDPLTGLPNRSCFRTYVDKTHLDGAASDQTFAVLVFDLDNFKYINDTLSHRVGDGLLMSVAKRLATFEIADGSAARLGGDEFVLAISYQNEAELVRQTSLIQANMAKPHIIDGSELIVTVSTGIALSPGDGTTCDALIQNAEMAMHRAKEGGRNNFRFFAKDMHSQTKRLLTLETGLHTALERNQFWLCYQPQFDSRSERIVGVEALIRWRHPELGAVPPSEFIPLAERNGQIIPIGTWVLENAIRQAKAWNDAGLGPLKISVNLSFVQFRQLDLPDSVACILSKTGLPPELLELELTETATMDDPEAAIAMTRKLSAIGVTLSIDDFGTGYSSFSYLKKLSIHRLKIDQSFVRDLGQDADDHAIVRSIINLGHNLGLTTIAEGVETAEQFDFLISEGCDGFQGYYFSRPLTSDEMLGRLQRSQQQL